MRLGWVDIPGRSRLRRDGCGDERQRQQRACVKLAPLRMTRQLLRRGMKKSPVVRRRPFLLGQARLPAAGEACPARRLPERKARALSIP
jgi:hypothetical protein